MSAGSSVTDWIGKLKAGDEAAAEKLWNRYYFRLVALCRGKLAKHQRRAYDEEDVALSAFDSFCQGARQGRFPLLRDRDNLWPLLVTIATRKAADHVEYQHRKKRGGGQVHGEWALGENGTSSSRGSMDHVVGDEPTPEVAAIVAEEYDRLMDSLDDDTLRAVAQWKLEGYTNKEIAHRLDCSHRTVARKLWLIRTTWSKATRTE